MEPGKPPAAGAEVVVVVVESATGAEGALAMRGVRSVPLEVEAAGKPGMAV